MRVATPERPPYPTIARIALLLAGANYALVALALLFAPHWFYETMGNFPPFNRHYEGDVGAFLLPLGMGLLIAAFATDPARYAPLTRVALAGGIIHLLNHLFDAIAGQESWQHWLLDLGPLVLLAVLTLVADPALYRRLGERNTRAST